MKWALFVLLAGCASEGAEPFVADVIAFEDGENAGYGQDQMPDIVLGAPHGQGEASGSLDVISLGVGGSITLELGVDVVDGPGIDLLVFENTFRYGDDWFLEPGEVAVSEDGTTFTAFPCSEVAPFEGCAGLAPVFANEGENAIDPRDPKSAGGDGFDLANIGVARARFVRVRDIGAGPDVFVGSGGFDLDAIAVVNE